MDKKDNAPVKKRTVQEVIKKNRQLILLALLVVISLLIARKPFFIILFIALNYFILWMKLGMGIDSPVEIMSFGAFMCGYVYGPAEGVIVASSSLISISLTGRITMKKIMTNIIFILIGYSAHFFRAFDLAFIGISFLVMRYAIDYFFYLVILKDNSILAKIPDRVINLVFNIILFFSFGKFLAGLMA